MGPRSNLVTELHVAQRGQDESEQRDRGATDEREDLAELRDALSHDHHPEH